MRTIYNLYSAFATLSLLCLILFTCKQHELGDTGFPRVRTLFVEMISDTGAVFKGEIMDIPADCEVLDHGFVWTEYPGATTYVEKVSLGSTRNTGEFKASASRAMAEGKKYYFKSFVQTPTLTIFGNELDFISLGSHKPEITSISPSSGSWSDTIVIHGKHFSNSTYQMYVMFGNKTSQNISSTSTEIRTIVPPDLDTATCKIGIKYANVLYPSERAFTLVPNVTVTSIEPASGSWNTVVKIRGKNLKYAQNILFNEISTPLKNSSDSLLHVVVPNGLTSINSYVYIKINSYKFSAPKKFTLIQGKIKSLSQESGTMGSQLVVNTSGIRTATAKVYLNGIEALVGSKTDSTMSVTLPVLQKSGKFHLTINDGPFEIESENLFDYKVPEFIGMYPEKSTVGDTVNLIGNNFNLLSTYSIKIGNQTCSIVSKDDKNIRIIIPTSLSFYEYDITITSGNYNFDCPIIYRRAYPIIESTEIVKENNAEYLIIKGNYFGPYYNYYGGSNYYITIPGDWRTLDFISTSKTELKYKLPGLLNGTYAIKLSYNSINYNIVKENAFIINNSPLSEYYSYENSEIAGGKFINNDENSLYISTTSNDFIFKFDLKSTEKIAKFLPYSSLMVKNNRDVIYLNSSDMFMKKINLDDKTITTFSKFNGGMSYYASGGVSNGKVYFVGCDPFMNYNYNYLHEFNGNWNTIANLAVGYEPQNLFEYNNELYIIGYMNSWKLNNYQLTKLSFHGGTNYPYLICIISSKAYFSLGDNIYEYNIPENVWTKICLAPNFSNPHFFMSRNGKGYFGIINNNVIQIIEFDPSKIN